jgi:hypothetical protein
MSEPPPIQQNYRRERMVAGVTGGRAVADWLRCRSQRGQDIGSRYNSVSDHRPYRD